MIRGYRSSIVSLIVCLLILYLGGTVWASPEDAALCKEEAPYGYPRAIEACTRQIESNPDDLESVFWRGVAYYFRGLYGSYSAQEATYQSALNDFNKYLDAYPKDMQALENRAQCYTKIKRYNEAIADASEVIAVDRTSVAALMTRGGAYLYLARYEESIDDLSRVIALNPEKKYTKRVAYSDRAISYRALGKYEQAITDFKAALAVEPNYEIYDGWIAECLTKMGRKGEAIEKWKEYIVKIDKIPNSATSQYYINCKAEALAAIEKLKK